MRILQIFNEYAYVGGEQLAVERITNDLDAAHELRTITFRSKDWTKQDRFLSRISQFLKMACNPDSVRRVFQEIDSFHPDVILLHNLMPVGSACLYWRLSRCGIPLIHYIHNFRPFSVNGYCWGNGRLLPQGLDKNFIPEILAGAWQSSVLKTAWYAILLWILHVAGVFRRIHGWIAISHFMKDIFVKSGIDENKIKVISHAWKATCPVVTDSENRKSAEDILFLGRLTEEKGILVLLDAWAQLEKKIPRGRLLIAGDGPLSETVRLRCESLNRAEYLGFTSGEAKRRLLASCRALVVPSIWWEPLGLVLYEAYEYSKPVIAARSGGIVDHVTDQQTGWLHEPGNVSELTCHLIEAIENPSRCHQMGIAGRLLLDQRASEDWLKEFNCFTVSIIGHKTTESDSAIIDNSPPSLRVMAYLADQNPNQGRSLGISRMTGMVLNSLSQRNDVTLGATVSRSSMHAPAGSSPAITVPWSTRHHILRALTDNLHPLFALPKQRPDVWYFPKGFMPRVHWGIQPSVATIHDTIIQYYQDHYPHWRLDFEYNYWAGMLRNTLVHATAIMTVSHHAKRQLEDFIQRHDLPMREIHVTYEPCLYEDIPQPVKPPKTDHVVHLGSMEPHKRTAWLMRLWADWATTNPDLPTLHVIGRIPEEVAALEKSCPKIVIMSYLEDKALISQFTSARALILPSEVEGFGLPAIEAYYLGTPVCYVSGTSVEEVLEPATTQGGFDLDQPDSLRRALTEVLAMPADVIHSCGMQLRDKYNSTKVVEHMMQVFRSVAYNR